MPSGSALPWASGLPFVPSSFAGTSPSSVLWAGGPGALPSVHLSPPLLGELPCPCPHRAACPWPALRLLGCSSCPGFPGLPCVPSPPRPAWCFSASLPSTVQACLRGTLNSPHIVPSSLRPVWIPSSSKPSWAWRSWVGWPYSGDQHPGQQTLLRPTGGSRRGTVGSTLCLSSSLAAVLPLA